MGPVYDTLCYDKREDNFTFAVQICKPNQMNPATKVNSIMRRFKDIRLILLIWI